MSEELQSDGAATETKTEEAPVENQEIGSELATDSGGEHEKTPQVDEAAEKAAAAQAATQEVINRKHFEAKQAERERDTALAQLAEFEKSKREADAAQAGNIPELPDQYDDNFAEKLQLYNDAIARQATVKEQQASYVLQQQNQQVAAQLQVEADNLKKTGEFSQRGVDFGIDAQELLSAANTVMALGLPPAAQQLIRDDPMGPLMLKHMAGNQSEIFAVANLASEAQMGAYLEGMKPKAELLRPKTTNTPDPVDNLTGNGVKADLNKYPNSAGGKFY